MKLTAAVIDDEPLARSRLARFLTEMGVEVVAQGADGQEALDIASSYDVDLLFLDINMPKINGLDVGNKISSNYEQPPAIIYCTAYDNYAIEAFNANAVSYILKPFSKEDLNEAISRATSLNKAQALQLQTQKNNDDFIIGSEKHSVERVSLIRVMFIEAINKHSYATLTDNTQILVNTTLKQIEEKHSTYFFRVNRSTLVAQNKIRSLISENGVHKILLQDSSIEFNVSRRRLSEAKKVLKHN